MKFLFAVVIGVVFGCVSGSSSPLLADEVFTITMQRGACWGACPVYSVTISSDGTVIYDGKARVKVNGQKTYTLGRSRIKQLRKEILDLDFFALKDRYTVEEGYIDTDRSSTTISLTMGGRTKQVYIYNWRRAPKQLTSFADKLDKIAGLKKVIGY